MVDKTNKKTKTKPLSPSLREKKRYIRYEVLSETKLSQEKIEKAITKNTKALIGELNLSKTGMIILRNKYDEEKQSGIIKVNNKKVDEIKTALGLIKNVDDQAVIFTTTKVSGILKKATN
ncbi:hypothetical protein GOV05_01220 [Candidatus Woesearchaeota archaeon]|nr:hypothetical protein [Candidatus Woesearchaeota archaeon]